MTIVFASAMAEEAAELAQALEGASKEEVLLAGTIAGAALSVISMISIVWFIVEIIGNWKIFTKAGIAGWKSIIPIYSDYVEYDHDKKKKFKQDKETEICSPIAFLHKYRHIVQTPCEKEFRGKNKDKK